MRKLAAAVLRKKTPRPPDYEGNSLGVEQRERQAEAGLKAAGIKTAELERVKGSDACKVLLAHPLGRRTVVSQQWLAEKLRMKSSANVSQQLRHLDRRRAPGEVPEAMRHFLEQTDDDTL